jgi:hypothetical protein
MKAHLTKFWSWYGIAVAVAAPYSPFINGAITQTLAGHPKVVAGVAAVAAWVAHRLPPPSSVA